MSDELKNLRPEIVPACASMISLREVGDSFKVLLRVLSDVPPRTKYTVGISGTSSEDGTQFDDQVYDSMFTREEVDRGFAEIQLSKSILTKCIDQSNITLKCAILEGGTTKHYPWIRYMVKHDYIQITRFNRQQLEGWILGSEVDSANIEYGDYFGKKCLQYNAENESVAGEKTIIYKDFNLREGKKYIVRAEFYVLPPSAGAGGINFTLFCLKEGRKGVFWHFNSNVKYLHPIPFGITVTSLSTRIEIAVSGQGGARVDSFALGGVVIAEHNPLRQWDPDYDLERDVSDPAPVKEPQPDSPEL